MTNWMRSIGAYDTFWNAAWSGATVSKAMSKIAAIDGRRGEYAQMAAHARTAVETSARHPPCQRVCRAGRVEVGQYRRSPVVSRASAPLRPDERAGLLRKSSRRRQRHRRILETLAQRFLSNCGLTWPLTSTTPAWIARQSTCSRQSRILLRPWSPMRLAYLLEEKRRKS